MICCLKEASESGVGGRWCNGFLGPILCDHCGMKGRWRSTKWAGGGEVETANVGML